MKTQNSSESQSTKKSNHSKHPKCHPVHDEPAFILESPEGGAGNVLIIADLHFGIEHSLELAGARLPSQTNRITERILSLCAKYNITQLILLGDIKHTVPQTSKQEWRELPKVFTQLLAAVDSIELFPGNHDGNLHRMIPQDLTNVHFHPTGGAVLHGLGLFHGHTWPTAEVMSANQVIMAHNHPNVLFIDKLGGRASYSCWLRGRFHIERALERYPEIADGNNDNGPEVIIMPAFNDIGSGTPVNASKPEFLGPLLRNHYVDFESAHVYLLDGTDLGKLRELINLSSISK